MESANNRYKETRKATLVGAGANIFLAAAKIVFGFTGHSQALIADGIHSLSDLLTDLLVILAAKFANLKADDNHPYGHERIETAATVALSLMLIIVGVAIIYDGISDLLHQNYGDTPHGYVLWIAGLSVIVNEGIYRYTRLVARKIKSDILHANALHSRSDAASSVVVLVGVAGSIMGFIYLDAIAAIIVGCFIIKMGAQIGWQNISELVDTGVEHNVLEQIKTVITEVPGVQAIHMLRTRKMAGRIMIDVHLIVPEKVSVSEGHHIGDRVLSALYEKINGVQDVTVHIDSENDELYSECAPLPLREHLIPQLMAAWVGLPGVNEVKNIDLHYIRGAIDVIITLPYQLIQTGINPEDLLQQYRQRVQSMGEISHLNLVFA
jgi:cation diffusion facilitator family transporter